MFILLNCILLTIVIVPSKASFNANPTTSVLGLDNGKGTTVQISDDESMIAAGFSDGTFKIFDIGVNQICSNTSTVESEIIQAIWMSVSGPVTVDMDNKVTLWSTECQSQSQMSFNQSIYRMTFREQTNNVTGNTTGIVALNFQDRIEEYNIQNLTNNLLTYTTNINNTFIDLVYFDDGTDTFMVASTSGSQIRVFNISDGSETNSFDIESSIEKMIVVATSQGNRIVGYGLNNNVYRFTSNGDVYSLGWFRSSTSIAICPSTIELALSQIDSKNIGVYLYSGNQQKSLTGLNGIAQEIDCSKSYLVSIDNAGFINVYTYEAFKSWIIGLIVGIVVGLLVLIILVIVFIRLRKKWAEQADQEKYWTKKPKKYPRNNITPSKSESMKRLHNLTLQTLAK